MYYFSGDLMARHISIRTKMTALIGAAVVIGFALMIGITSYYVKKALVDEARSGMDKVTKLVETNVKQFYSQTLDLVAANFATFRDHIYSKGNFSLSPDETENFNAVNQVSKEADSITIPAMIYNGRKAANDFELVDKIVNEVKIKGLTATIFQKIPGGLLRITTNVMKTDGKRAVGTYIPVDSAVYKTVMKGETYKGRAFVVNQWYWTVYEPIVIDGKTEGVLYMGIEEAELIKTLKQSMTDIKIGRTGYPFIFDSKGTMIIHPTLTGKNVIDGVDADGIKIFDQMVRDKDGWINYRFKKPDSNEIAPKITRFLTVSGLDWIIAAGSYEDEFYDSAKSINTKMIVLGLMMTTVMIIIMFFVAGIFAKMIIGLSESMRDVSGGGGDLTKQIKIASKDEIGELTGYFNKFIVSLDGIVSQVKDGVLSVSEANNEIVAATEELAATFSQQSNELGDINYSVEEVNNLAGVVISNLEKTERTTHDASVQTEDCRMQLGGAIAVVQEIKAEVHNLAGSIERLGKSSNEIGQILSVINDIADQTNLLALNAAIEAARAGEAGRGFAVVADEVRKLAEKTQASTKEINAIIKSLQIETAELDESMVRATESVQNGVDAIQETGKAFETIVNAVEGIEESAQTMTAAVNDQNMAITNITERVSSVTIGVEQSADAVHNVAMMLNQAKEQIDNLEKLMGGFKTTK